jgi:phage terminase large subunit GpA-like protein
VPYLREPMECLHPDHPSRRVTLKFSAQTGKSEVGVNWFCYIVDRAPGPMLSVLLKRGGDGRDFGRRLRLQFDHAIDEIGCA